MIERAGVEAGFKAHLHMVRHACGWGRTTAEQASVIVCYKWMDTVLEFATSLIGLVLLGAALMFSLGCYFLWRGRRKLKGS